MLEWGGRRFRPVAPTTRVRNRQEAPIQRNRDNGVYLTGSFIQPNQQDGVAPSIPVEVSIAPSSAIQYENVSLSASTTGTSPTFTWTLVDFYDTTDTPITSYVGAVVPTGYFTSTGSSNVSVSVVCVEGTAVNSTFSVSAFSPDDVSDLFAWIDFSDDSTITYRTGTNYIESINEKTGKWVLSQPTASYQPLMLTGGSTDRSSLLQVASFDGIDNYFLSNGLASPITTFTAHTSFTMGTQKVKGSGEPNGRSMYWEIGRTISANGSTSFSDRRDLCRRDDYSQLLGIGYAFGEDSRTNYNASTTDYPQAYVVRRDKGTGSSQLVNDIPRTSYDVRTQSWYVRDFVIGTQGNVNGTSIAHKLFGEYWESLHYSRDLTTAEEAQINRYMNYKWFGVMNY